jgi:DNA-binding PadR family transcriptional regulator
MVYRTLRRFEQDGLVCSTWDTESGGPARRVYHMTDKGLSHLRFWAQEVNSVNSALEEFLADYQSLGSGQLESSEGG